MVVDPSAAQSLREQVAAAPSRLKNLPVFTQPGFAAYAAWGGPHAWDRYSFVGVRTLIDRTGQIQSLIADKASIPAHAARAFIDAALDLFLNPLYRALKGLRDGDALASRLDGAQAPQAFLDVIVALNGGRLRPSAKYLAWELETCPLAASPWTADAILARLEEILSPVPTRAQQALLEGLEPLARGAGHDAARDAWRAALPWMRTWRHG